MNPLRQHQRAELENLGRLIEYRRHFQRFEDAPELTNDCCVEGDE